MLINSPKHASTLQDLMCAAEVAAFGHNKATGTLHVAVGDDARHDDRYHFTVAAETGNMEGEILTYVLESVLAGDDVVVSVRGPARKVLQEIREAEEEPMKTW
jgi:hypothetical protein